MNFVQALFNPTVIIGECHFKASNLQIVIFYFNIAVFTKDYKKVVFLHESYSHDLNYDYYIVLYTKENHLLVDCLVLAWTHFASLKMVMYLHDQYSSLSIHKKMKYLYIIFTIWWHLHALSVKLAHTASWMLIFMLLIYYSNCLWIVKSLYCILLVASIVLDVASMVVSNWLLLKRDCDDSVGSLKGETTLWKVGFEDILLVS